MIQLEEVQTVDIKGRRYRVHDVMRDLAQHNLKEDMGTGNRIAAAARDCLYAAGLKHSALPKEWTQSSAELTAKRMSLIANDLDEFPGSKPFRAPDLHVLLLSQNFKLRSLSTTLSQSVSNLTVLDVRHTSIEEIPDGVLRGLAWLTLLDLTNCDELRTVSDDVDSLQSLEFLSLKGCSKLKNLPQVSRLTNLRRFATTIPRFADEMVIDDEDEEFLDMLDGLLEREDEESQDREDREDEEFEDEQETEVEDEERESKQEQDEADIDSQTQQEEAIFDDEGTARQRFTEEVSHPILFHLPRNLRKLFLCQPGSERGNVKYSFDISALADLEELDVSWDDIPFPACEDSVHHLSSPWQFVLIHRFLVLVTLPS